MNRKLLRELLKTIPVRVTRFPIVAGLALIFMLAGAFSLALTDQEADQKLREMGFNVDDPSFPPDLLEAFREMARSMAASDELYLVSSSESFTYSEGGVMAMQQISPLSADSLNHGTRISYDDALGLFTFSWWGRADHEYLVEFSQDLVNWDTEPQYVVMNDPLPVLEEGLDAPLEIEFETGANRLFLRLRVTDNSPLEIESFDVTESDWTPYVENQLVDIRKTMYFQITLSPEQDSLATVLANPAVQSISVDGNEVSLNESNTQFANENGQTVLRVTIEPADWTMAFSSFSSTRKKASYDTGAIDPSQPSNLTDSDAFMDEFNWEFMSPIVSRGRASRLPGDLPLGTDSVRYAGWRSSLLTLGTTVTLPVNVPDQANFFYYSGHGSHQSGLLIIDDIVAGGEYLVGAGDVEWDDGLEVVILAGCSVLDINDYNNNSNAPSGWKPGDAWSQTGPSMFLGYNWSAPLDLQDGTYAARDAIRYWINQRDARGDTMAWHLANNHDWGYNACAIDVTQGIGNRIYYYFHRSGFPGFRIWTWNGVPESQW